MKHLDIVLTIALTAILAACNDGHKEKLATLIAQHCKAAVYDQGTNTVTFDCRPSDTLYDFNNHPDIATQWAVTQLQRNMKRDRVWLDILTAVRKSGATIQYQITYPNGQRQTAIVYPTMLPGAFNTKEESDYLELRSNMLLLNTTLPREIKPGIILTRQRLSKTQGLIDELLYPNSNIGDQRQFVDAVRRSHAVDVASYAREAASDTSTMRPVALLVKLGLPRVYRKSQPNHLCADDIITVQELRLILEHYYSHPTPD